MIDIKPDPKHPRGGFALITVKGVAQTERTLEVAVYNAYQQKWLGEDGWQANRMTFPVRAQAWANDTLQVVVGPDVVNQIDDDTPLKVEMGGQAWDTYWPDDINHGPDVAVVGGISGAAAAPAPKGPKTVTALPQTLVEPDVVPDPEPEPEPVPEPVVEVDPPEELGEQETAGGSKLPLILGGVLVLAALAAAAWYFLMAGEPEEIISPVAPIIPAPAQVPPLPAPVAPAPQANACAADALRTLADGGFGPLADQLRSCGAAVSADDALGFVERAAIAGDGDALALFGALYDETVTDAEIEGQIGLTFADEPAVAAAYYARARNAGSELGAQRLTAVCLRLALDSGTLAQSAREDYCQ